MKTNPGISQGQTCGVITWVVLLAGLHVLAGDFPGYVKKETWQETITASMQRLATWEAAQTNRCVRSRILRGGDRAETIRVSIAGWKTVCLIVNDDGDYHHDVANWGNAKILIRDGPDLYLDALEPVSARQDWGTFRRDGKSAVGGPLQVAEAVFEHGIGTHANSLIRYQVPADATWFEARVGIDISRGANGRVQFVVAESPEAVPNPRDRQKIWELVKLDFPDTASRRQIAWEQADKIWDTAWGDPSELARRYAAATRGAFVPEATELAKNARNEADVRIVRSVYYRARAFEEALAQLDQFNFQALRLAITDLSRTFGEKYPQGPDYLRRLDRLQKSLTALRGVSDEWLVEQMRQLNDLFQEALLANPLLDFDRLLLVRRNAANLGLPQNWQGNSSLPRSGFDNEIAVLAPVTPEGRLTTLYRPEGGKFVGDLELHFDAGRLLFSSMGAHNRWQIFELSLAGASPRQVTPGDQPDVDNYDACYLPDDRMIFSSTACFIGVPCVDGSDHVANLYRLERDGQTIRQLCFDQDHNWCPTVLNNGRVLYQRWEYADTPHSQTRLLFHMNPDGTGQMEFYGSNSQWPNAKFYARPIPGHPTKVVAIVGGHHGVPRMGELVIFDPAKGRQEASGVVQRIPGHGQKVEPIIRDQLVDHSWPKFLHPYPLNEHYFLVSAKPSPEALWGIYLVDIFDNMLLLAEHPGQALLEPIPLRKTSRPPVIPDQIDPARRDAVVQITDIYQGDGLKGVPRGTVKRLRVFAYHWAYEGMGGLLGTIGLDGPWDIRRILGTVPVAEDGSALFRVPANTPISIQPLDHEGRALQVMRSWMTAMPGEHVACAGCHERQNGAPPNLKISATRARQPDEIEPWHGPARGFSYAREIQPVIDRHCVECHDGQRRTDGKTIPDLRGNVKITDFRMVTPGWGSRLGGRFSVGYAQLHRYVRRPGIESDYHLLKPLEYHASTTELAQMLQKGHQGVTLDAEAWDRLYTWIDLNAPYHGTWHEELDHPGPIAERRKELRQRYAGMEDDPEAIPKSLPRYGQAASQSGRSLPLATRASQKAVTTSEPPRPVILPQQNELVIRNVDLGNRVLLRLVRIPAGEFLMGDAAGESDESPPTIVRIPNPFWIAQTEISNEQFAQFDPAHDSHVESKTAYQFGVHGFPVNEPRQPVVRVNWRQAMAFCEWLSRKTGQTFTLPTEAQWEYACRAGGNTAFSYGTIGTDFAPWANLADAKLTEFASDPYTVFTTQSNPSPYEDYIPKDSRFNDGGLVTKPVGSYQPNLWGLQDMHGNVWEWTLTAYRAYPYVENDGRNEPTLNGSKVVRGGSWRDRPWRARASFRLAYAPWQTVFNVGFRVVSDGKQWTELPAGQSNRGLAQAE